MAWSGEASVSVSIANWIKGSADGKKRLYIQEGHKPDVGWRHSDFDTIGSSLSFSFDVTKAQHLTVNAKNDGCFQGQTHGYKAFLMSRNEGKLLIAKDAKYAEVVFPFLIANDLIAGKTSKPSRYVIDFQSMDMMEAAAFPAAFKRIQDQVLPARKKAAAQETERNKAALAANPKAKVNSHHANFLKHWWNLSYDREELVNGLKSIKRYISCGRVTKRPIFEFVSTVIRPNDACMVFLKDDDYSFGVLHSGIHWIWFINRCSTLTERFRYTSNSVFDSFPWPQEPSAKSVKSVAIAAVAFRKQRNELRAKHNLSLRDLYRVLDLPGEHPLKDAQASLDKAVRSVYGMSVDAEPLEFLLALNALVAAAEANGEPVQGPGLPTFINDRSDYVTEDCIAP